MDASPTALFDSYAQDFEQSTSSLREKLDVDPSTLSIEQHQAAMRRVEMELDEADEIVSQMEIELQGIPQNVKAQYQTRLRSSKAELSSLKTKFRQVKSSVARANLLSSSSPRDYATSDDPYSATSDRAKLLAGTELLENGTKRLQESQRMALETEMQGAEILSNLQMQRDRIVHSRDTLQGALSSVERASETLKGMIRRMYQQRVVTAAIIGVLTALIVFVVVVKLFF